MGRETETDVLFAGSLLKCLQQLGLGGWPGPKED